MVVLNSLSSNTLNWKCICQSCLHSGALGTEILMRFFRTGMRRNCCVRDNQVFSLWHGPYLERSFAKGGKSIRHTTNPNLDIVRTLWFFQWKEKVYLAFNLNTAKVLFSSLSLLLTEKILWQSRIIRNSYSKVISKSLYLDLRGLRKPIKCMHEYIVRL